MNAKIKGIVRTFFVASGLLVAVTALGAQQAAAQTGSAADNTAINQGDRNSNVPTADSQKDNRSDRDITQQIRKALMQDKSLSTYAHNVKVITQNGQVTLKGPVRSEDEKKAVESKATEIAGENKVTSELGIKSKN